MKTTKEKIEIMLAYEKGKKIQFKVKSQSDEWMDATPPIAWNWQVFDHRIKPKEIKVDWSKVTKGAAVLVRDYPTEPWEKGYFR